MSGSSESTKHLEFDCTFENFPTFNSMLFGHLMTTTPKRHHILMIAKQNSKKVRDDSNALVSADTAQALDDQQFVYGIIVKAIAKKGAASEYVQRVDPF